MVYTPIGPIYVELISAIFIWLSTSASLETYRPYHKRIRLETLHATGLWHRRRVATPLPRRLIFSLLIVRVCSLQLSWLGVLVELNTLSTFLSWRRIDPPCYCLNCYTVAQCILMQFYGRDSYPRA